MDDEQFQEDSPWVGIIFLIILVGSILYGIYGPTTTEGDYDGPCNNYGYSSVEVC